MDENAETFVTEVVKLLLQVVWADDEVRPSEAEALVRFARARGVSESKIHVLQAQLRGEQPLPPPNLGLLRQRRLEVLKAVKELLESDLSVSREEEQLLSQLSGLLK